MLIVGWWSACSPTPLDGWLSSCSWVWHNVLSLVQKFVVGAVVVVQHVKVSWVKEVAVLGVTEVDHSALLRLAIRVGNFDAVVAEAWDTHSTDSVKGNEALGKGLGLVVPVGAGVDIVGEICSEAISDLRSTVSMASNTLVANIGPRHTQILLNLQRRKGHN